MTIQAQFYPEMTRAAAPWRDRLGAIAVYTFIVGGALAVLFPFIWMFLGSFKDLAESNRFPPTILPEVWHPSNYLKAWTSPPGTLGRYLRNSAIIALTGAGLQTLICALAAYAFSRLRFRGRDLLFMLVLATTMVPGEITLIPNFVTIRRFPLVGGNDLWGAGGSGFYDTYTAMILPTLAGAFNIFLLRQAFLSVPNEFWEAAQLDGCGSFGFLWRIMAPLTLPALFTVSIFSFISRWNGLLWPLIVTRSEAIRPVQVAMIYYQSEFATDFGTMMAASLIATLPIIVLYVLVQRQFIAGIINTGLKG
jgi:multiple sugar transport system permease protein